MKNKTNLYIKLYCPRVSLLSPENLKKPKYYLTNPNLNKSSKRTYKKENLKIKESIYKFVRNTRKIQVKNEEKFINGNKNTINNYISVLNDANIDEGIVLNKYFAYVKKYNIEFEKSQQLKLKGKLIPIKIQEKLIKNLKKNIKFFKSLSNNMLMKYMIENKEKFTQYLDEISSYKTKNSSYNHNKKKYSIDINNYTSKSNKSKTILNTVTNEQNNRYQNHLKDKSNYNNLNTVSNLKLKLGEIKNKYLLTPYSRNKSKDKYSGKTNSTHYSNKDSIKINNKYYTPYIKKKFIKNCLDNNKNNEIQTSRSDNKLQNYEFQNVLNTFKKLKANEVNKVTLE